MRKFLFSVFVGLLLFFLHTSTSEAQYSTSCAAWGGTCLNTSNQTSSGTTCSGGTFRGRLDCPDAYPRCVSGSSCAAPTATPGPPGNPATPTPVPNITLTGSVYWDMNDDGSLNGGDSVYPGQTVTLFQTGSSNIYDYTTTDSSGVYCFGSPLCHTYNNSPVPAGSYTIYYEPPAGYNNSPPGSSSISRNFTSDTDSLNFGVQGPPPPPGISPNPPGQTCYQGSTVISFSYGSTGAQWYQVYWINRKSNTWEVLYSGNGQPNVFGQVLDSRWAGTANVIYAVIAYRNPSVSVPYSSSATQPITIMRCGYTIQGSVFIDANGNGTKDSGETNYTYNSQTGTATFWPPPSITITGPQNTAWIPDGAGNFLFPNQPTGTYTVGITLPPNSGYVLSTPASRQVNASGQSDPAPVNFGITPGFSISGGIFDDTDKDERKDSDESYYAKNPTTFTFSGPTAIAPITTSDGTFTTGNVLAPGTYTVSRTSSLPSGYYPTYPQNGPPQSLTVTIGTPPACSVPSGHDQICTANGHVQNLNFGISNYQQWFVCLSGDCRIERTTTGYSNPIPATAACNAGPYGSITGPDSSTPGIIFSGPADPNFGQGQASPNPYNWMVGSNLYPEVYQPTIRRTSYGYMTTTLRQSGVTPIDLRTVCSDLSDCTLPNDIANGVYLATDDVTLNAFTFPLNKQYIFLIDGNLRINGEIHVPVGTSATFSVSENIYIEKTIGVADKCSQTPNVEGWFSADDSFIVEGLSDCTNYALNPVTPPRDRRFNLAGGIVVNAGKGGGSFENQRDLCADDQIAPSFSLILRPDLILYAPEFIKFKGDVWQEVAP